MKFFFIPFIMVLVLISCSETSDTPVPERRSLLTLEDLYGTWKRRYSNSTGYQFDISRQSCLITLFLEDSTMVFSGKPFFSHDQLMVDVHRMKGTEHKPGDQSSRGFMDVAGTRFTFHVTMRYHLQRPVLQLKPLSVLVRGMDSVGFFEPVFILERD